MSGIAETATVVDEHELEIELEKRTMRKASWRILPFVMVSFFLCWLDRVNIGFAALTMREDLALTATMFGFGAGVFFIAYFLGEVPSNVLLDKFGARRRIARIMVTWGAISALMATVQGEYSFYALRFLLGLAEAGFFPGIIYYFTHWFPARHRGKIISRFMIASPCSLFVGAPISTWLLGFDGALGLHGWQFLFIAEGIPTVLFGIVIFLFLPDRPASAKWLADDEREWLDKTMKAEYASVQKTKGHMSLKEVFKNPIVLVLGLVYFLTQAPPNGLGMWIPQVVKAFGGLSTQQIGFVAAIPYAFAILGLVLWGQSSDRTMERKWHFLSATILAGVGMIIGSRLMDNPVLAMVFISASAMGIYALIPIFWTIPPMFLTGVGAAAGIALINAIGNLGGFAGPFIMGAMRDWTGDFAAGLTALGVMMLGATVIGCYCISKVQK